MFLVTSREMNKMDLATIDSFGIPERVLMENAGRGAANYFLELYNDKKYERVGILAGRGNNGGDAFVVARYLIQKNIAVTVFLLCEKNKVKQGAASANLDLLISLGISVIEIPDMDTFYSLEFMLRRCMVWIDGILGTGLRSDVTGFMGEMIGFINSLKQPVFALDIPSGLSSDTGQICGTSIIAFATVTFAFAKLGHFVYPGPSYVGKLKIVDIGIPLITAKSVGCDQYLLDFNHVKGHLFSRSTDAHKGTSGHLLVVAGSSGKTGAAVMTSLGAMRSGAGLVTLCIPERLTNVVESMVMEIMTVGLPETCHGDLDISAFKVLIGLLYGKKCVAFGPGFKTGFTESILLEKLIQNCTVPIVIDAGGLDIISNNTSILENKSSPIILTPHPGEMARLTGKSISYVQGNRISVARCFAKKFNVYIVLKGPGTVIAHPNGKIFINSTGNAGMASGGMGDVLTGMVAAFITQGYDVGFAIRTAVYIHGLAGDSMVLSKGPYGYLATDIINNIPEQIAALLFTESTSPFKYIDLLMYETDE